MRHQEYQVHWLCVAQISEICQCARCEKVREVLGQLEE